ncbi:DinB family protein [Gracilibacillus lacisalsi]|uniref:DinB family protein n=1 Tax=Gracilibacillus lacisalsi TaxID=393087 RepID=UPI000375585A|nr:DinB family protein [Gracilibacillus lacisalsi]
MKSLHMKNHFQKIYKQREEIKEELVVFRNQEWKRPHQDKWSWGETYYHLYLMMKWFRRLSKGYVPLSLPIATLRKNKPYKVHSTDVYAAYKQKNKKPMKAPFLLVPPKDIEYDVDFQWLIEQLDNETKQLEKIVLNITDDVAGHIRFPDPLANNPNLIQSIDLLGIHEKHHFLLCEKYYNE